MDENAGGLADLATNLRATFPDLRVAAPLCILGTGFHSIAVEAEDGAVFRVGKTYEAAAGYAQEAVLLPALRGRLPLGIPDPHWYARPCTRFPFGVIGYAKLPGIPLAPAALSAENAASLATTLGVFLHALHSFPTSSALDRGVPGPGAQRDHHETVRLTVLPLLRAALSVDEHRIVERWWDDVLTDPDMTPDRAMLCHGDLWYENILVDAERPMVRGVIDFEDANVGDSAQDFAALRHLGDRFVIAAIDAYRIAGGMLTPTFAHRVQRYWEMREFGGVYSAARRDDESEFADSMRKLRAGAILNPSAHPPLQLSGA